MTHHLARQLSDRFYRYLSVTSQSNAAATTLPSTPEQHKMAQMLADELHQLGLQDVVIDQHATVTAVKPGNVKGAPKVGFITHIDTVDVGLSPHIHPQTLRFDGQDLCLNAAQDIWLRVAEHPEIAPYVGQDIIFSDGTSVLGADNKAAVTVVMTLLENLNDSTRHGDIVVAFVPDEEIGLRGAKALDLEKRFNVDFAWTIDCCELGEVVYENFNAAAAEIRFTGVTAHPMSGKGVLVNPLLMAHDFISHFDRLQTPEHTEGREGYTWFNELQAGPAEARLKASLRDFDVDGLAARKQQIRDVAAKIDATSGGSVAVEISDTYSNISNAIGDDRRAIDLIFSALEQLDIPPKVIAMRGGTDGAALSAKGLLTPNFFTGAHNFHSRFEFLPVTSFVKSYQVALRLCELAAKGV